MAQPWAKQFYNSKQWKDLRKRLLIDNHYRCSICGKDFTLNPSELIGHHKIELTAENINNAAISLNPANVEIICYDCHNRVHERYGYHRSTRNVYIVYGAPCSGKSTYVQQHSKRGDLIVDIDKIFESISGRELYDKPESLKFQAFAIRDLLIEQIKTRSGSWRNAFVIGGYPRKIKREQLAQKLKAELIFIDVTREEAHRRALLLRGEHGKEWVNYIDRWFNEFQE